MAEDFGESRFPDYGSAGEEQEKKNNRIWIIVAIVLVVLCCCLAIGAYGLWWLWNNGDALFGLASQLSLYFI